MNKQRLMSFLSLLGFIFIIGLAISSYNQYQNRGGLITRQVDVPASFARQFNRVVTKRREEQMVSAPFLNTEGKRVDWPNFTNDYTLVNFWATWCAPCVTELPSLDKLQKRYTDQGLNVIAVSLEIDRGQEYVRNFLDKRNIGQFAAHFDYEHNIHRNIRMRGIPTSYLFDSKGNILYVFEGDANWVSIGAIEFFDTLLKQNN